MIDIFSSGKKKGGRNNQIRKRKIINVKETR
jgi:hypothetical protein